MISHNAPEALDEKQLALCDLLRVHSRVRRISEKVRSGDEGPQL